MLRESWGKSRTRTPAVREASDALGGFPGASAVKSLPANAGDSGDVGSIPGSGRSPGRGHGNPLQYSCLENPMDGRAWWTIVHRVAESDMTQ